MMDTKYAKIIKEDQRDEFGNTLMTVRYKH